MRWRILSDAREVTVHGGYDGVAWAWDLASADGAQRRTVVVKLTGTLMMSESIAFRNKAARDSKGQTEVRRILDWEDPPSVIEFGSSTWLVTGGEPGAEVREITEITDWFEQRGATLVFGGPAYLFGPPDEGEIVRAHLVSYSDDKVLDTFEAGSALEAARAAKVAWEARTDITVVAPPASAFADAPAPTVRTGLQMREYGFGLRWIEIGTTDTPMWMVEVYDSEGNFLTGGFGDDREDAILGVAEELLPPNHS